MIELRIAVFECGTEKEAALKPLEEAAEAYGAWQDLGELVSDDDDGTWRSLYAEMFADEIADCVQACANLAARYGIDLAGAMARCEKRNRERGRYGR